jgi:hypothetical protein
MYKFFFLRYYAVSNSHYYLFAGKLEHGKKKSKVLEWFKGTFTCMLMLQNNLKVAKKSFSTNGIVASCSISNDMFIFMIKLLLSISERHKEVVLVRLEEYIVVNTLSFFWNPRLKGVSSIVFLLCSSRVATEKSTLCNK